LEAALETQMALTRTFIAVEAAPEIRSRVADLVNRLRVADATVKWVEPENLHWTLKFLGDVSDEDIAHVCRHVGRVASSIEPFRLQARGAGAFPDSRRPRTLWVGVSEGEEEMIALQTGVEDALRPLGFQREGRRFKPHLTIGRVRAMPREAQTLGELIERHRDFDAGAAEVDELIVMASYLDRTGPTYQPLGRAPLGERFQ
jgi:2'-5' RNA ligase